MRCFVNTIFPEQPVFYKFISIRGGVKKKVVLLGGGGCWGGGGGGLRPDHNFRPKKYHFLFLLPFDAEAFKTCKNTIKLINLCGLPCLGLDLWLTLKVYFDLA